MKINDTLTVGPGVLLELSECWLSCPGSGCLGLAELSAEVSGVRQGSVSVWPDVVGTHGRCAPKWRPVHLKS